MKLIETYSDIEREVKQDKINNFIDQFVFSNSLRRHGGPMLIFWEWIIAVPHEDVYDEEFKKRQWVFRLRSSTSPIPHSPHKDDPYFILNNKVVEYVSEGLSVSDDESREFLIDWFITNIYNDKEFKKEYIENFIYGMAKKRDNLIMGPIEKQKLKGQAKNIYDVLIPQYIQLALKPQNYAENSFSYRINEQKTGSDLDDKDLVPDIVYRAIEKIEAKYSYMGDDGQIKGATYDGRDIQSELRVYIKATIGLDSWFKMSEKLRGQVYAFAFQSDSESNNMKFRWIAGLANAINPSINRLTIVVTPPSKNCVECGPKDLNTPAVKNAISIIKKACQENKINNYYEKYLTVLDQQYLGLNFKDNYKYIWRYRPIAIDRFIKGESEEKIFEDWVKSFGDQNLLKQVIDVEKLSY